MNICAKKCSWETLVCVDPRVCDSWISPHRDLHRTHALIKNTHTYTDDDHAACKSSAGSGGGYKRSESSRNAALMARLPLFTTNLANWMLEQPTWNLLEWRLRGGGGNKGNKRDICVCVCVCVCDCGALTKAVGVIQ